MLEAERSIYDEDTSDPTETIMDQVSDTLDLIDEKRKWKKGSERYRELKREVRGKLRQDNRDHIDGICTEMEECQRQHNTRTSYLAWTD